MNNNSNPIPEEFQLLDKYWRASNYLSVGQVSSIAAYLILVSSFEEDSNRDGFKS